MSKIKIEINKHYFTISPELTEVNKRMILSRATGLTKGNNISFFTQYPEELKALTDYFSLRGLKPDLLSYYDPDTKSISDAELKTSYASYLILSEADYNLVEELWESFCDKYSGIVVVNDSIGLYGVLTNN